MNVEKTKVMRISRQSLLIQITINKKQLVHVEYFKYFEVVIKSDARGIREIKFRIFMAKTAFNKNTALLTSISDLNLRKKGYIWIIALYGAETWTLQKVDHKYLGRCEM